VRFEDEEEAPVMEAAPEPGGDATDGPRPPRVSPEARQARITDLVLDTGSMSAQTQSVCGFRQSEHVSSSEVSVIGNDVT